MVKKVTYKQIEATVLKLRLEKDQSDARLLMYIFDVEQKYLDVLKKNGFPTVENWIKTKSLADCARYRGFVAGMKKTGRNEALSIGADATIVAAKLSTNGEVAEEYVKAIEDWSTEKGGILPTQETCARIRRQIDPQKEIPKATARRTALEQENANLRAENTLLRAKVRTLESELKRTKQELAKLEKYKDKAQRAVA